MIQRKEVFYCKYCPIRKTCFSFLHSQQGSHFFLEGGGRGCMNFMNFSLYFVICVYVLHVCLCEMLMLVHYWKDICKFWDFISGKNLPNQETLQVDFHFVPDHFFFNYKTLKFYVLCIGREKILYFPARKVLRMLLLSCSLYIHSVTDIDMVITQHISSFVLTLEISVH